MRLWFVRLSTLITVMLWEFSSSLPEPLALIIWQLLFNRKAKLTSAKMTPFDDFMFLINSILLGEEPVSIKLLVIKNYPLKIIILFFSQTIEDFILLVGTFVAFVAFVLWCCFPIAPKEIGNQPGLYEDRYTQYRKADSPDADWCLSRFITKKVDVDEMKDTVLWI